MKNYHPNLFKMSFNICLSLNYGSPPIPYFFYQVKSATDGRDETVKNKYVSLHTLVHYIIQVLDMVHNVTFLASDDGSSYINLKPEMRHYIGYTLSIT